MCADEYTQECLAIRVLHRLKSCHAIEVLADALIAHGICEHSRSDNSAKFVAKELLEWLARTGTRTLYIVTGSQ